MKDNNQLLAEKIYEIENANFKQVKEWHKNNVTRWNLTDDIYMEKSEDYMCWYLWKYNEGKCDYGYFKVIPRMHYRKEDIAKMLEAQHWVWI